MEELSVHFFPLKNHSVFQRNLPRKGLFEFHGWSCKSARFQIISASRAWCWEGDGAGREVAVFSLGLLHIPGSGGINFILTPLVPSIRRVGKGSQGPPDGSGSAGLVGVKPCLDLCEFAAEERKTLVNLNNTLGTLSAKGGEGIGWGVYLF